MENNKNVAPSFDDLVFENRNKEYGAYSIRKKYNKTMMFAILVGAIIIGTAVVTPYIFAKVNDNNNRRKLVEVKVTMTNLADPNDTPPPPPPPPPPPTTAEAQVKFVAPVVVDSLKVTDQSFATADEAQEVVKNEDVNIVKVVDEVVEQPKEEEVFFIVEEMPGFQGGGIEGFRNYVQKNLVYPEVAQENGIQGKVYISFVIESNGKISNVKVVRGVDPALDKAAVKAVEGGPNWTPGKQRGKPVRVTFTIPITFVLQ